MIATVIDTHQFYNLMSRLARAWNKQDATGIAACFAPHAMITDVTQARHCTGQETIQQHIEQTLADGAVHTVWHHLLFDEESQVGSGEYSFSIHNQHRHGVALVKIIDGKIAHWRSYEVPSDLGWQQFVGPNSF